VSVVTQNYLNKVYQDKYKIEKEIVGGEYEYSFVGRDLKNNKPVHIRVIPIDAEHPELVEQSQNFVFKEVSLLQRLNFPGLPVFLESFSGKEDNVIVTEYVEIWPLNDRMEKNPNFSEQEVMEFLDKLLPILDYLHSQTPPVIYRDLQPRTIFEDNEGKLYLTKYEAARTFKADKVKDTVIHSTRGYSPPEQAFGKGQSDARSDIYSVGMIVFQMFTGKDPTKAPLILPKISDIRPEVNTVWSTFVSKATNIKVDKRYASVKEVMKDLQKVKEGGAIEEEVLHKVTPEPVKAEEPKKKIKLQYDQEPEKAAETKAAEASPEPDKKAEPAKAPEVKAEPAKAEPVKEPAKEPAQKKEEKKAEPAKVEKKAEPAKAEPVKEPAKEPAQKKEEKREPEKPRTPPAKTAGPVHVYETPAPEPKEVNPWAYFMMLLSGVFLIIALGSLATSGKGFNDLLFWILAGAFVIGSILSYTLFNSGSEQENK
jgi:serine/threonine protein kinase